MNHRRLLPLEEYARTDDRIRFIDVATHPLDCDGQLLSDIFPWDGVHVNTKGYGIWASALKPIEGRDFDPQVGNERGLSANQRLRPIWLTLGDSDVSTRFVRATRGGISE